MECPVSGNSRACSSGIHTAPEGDGNSEGVWGAESILHPFVVSHHHLVAKRLSLDSSASFRVSCKAVFCLKPEFSKRVLICRSYSGLTPAFVTMQDFLPCGESPLPTANWHLNWLIFVVSWTPRVCTQLKWKCLYVLLPKRTDFWHHPDSQHQSWNPRRWESVV